MNPIIIKVASLSLNHILGFINGSSKQGAGTQRNFPEFLESLSMNQKRADLGNIKPSPMMISPKERGRSYLESLRKSLLKNGKPLEEITLRPQDFHLFEKFLHDCGFSPDETARLLKELAENHPKGEINLAQFFSRADELGSSESSTKAPVIIDPSAIPYLESVLKSFGLSQDQLNDTFTGTKLQGKGLDLHRLITALKQINNQSINEKPLMIRHGEAPRVCNALRKIGIHLQEDGKAGRITMEQFINSLENNKGEEEKDYALSKHPKTAIIQDFAISNGLSTGRAIGRDLENSLKTKSEISGKDTQLPVDVKDTIDQLLERIASNQEKKIHRSPFQSKSRFGLSLPFSHTEKGKTANPAASDNLNSQSKFHANTDAENIQQMKEVPNIKNAISTSFSLGDSKGLDKGNLKERVGGIWEKAEVGTIQGMARSSILETVNESKHVRNLASDSFPVYLIDQVKKQIFKSLTRSEKIIRLQLKPPELGSVRVEMEMKNNVLKLGMIAENTSVKEILLSNVHELKESLLEQGVNLEKIDVQISDHSEHPHSNTKEGAKDEQRWGQGAMESLMSVNDKMEEAQAWPLHRSGRDQLLDLMA